MDAAAAISNVPVVNAPPPLPGGAATTATSNNGTAPATSDAKPQSGFAQIVHEIMIRTTAETPAQPVRLLKTSPSSHSKTTTVAPTSTDSSSSNPALVPAGIPVDLTVLGLLVVPIPVAPAEQPQLPAQPTDNTAQVVPASANATSRVEVPPVQIKSTFNSPLGAAAQPPQFLSPLLPTTLNVQAIPSNPDGSATIVGNLTSTSNLQLQQAPSPAQQTPTTPENVVSLPEKTASIQVSAKMESPLQGEPLSSVLQQIAQLQSPDTSSSVATYSGTSGISQPSSHPQLAQTAMKPALDVTALAGIQSAQIPTASLNSKLTLPIAEAPHSSSPLPPLSPAPSNHSDNRDALSNQNGQSSSDLLASKEQPSSTQNTPDFSQTLSAANNTKVDPTPSATNSVPLVQVPATLPSEHASTVAKPPAPSPAPSQPALNFVNSDPPTTRLVNDAQLVQIGGHSEMRIAMQTDKLGAIELHARVAGDEVGAAITVEKRDAHAVLSVELPALQQALSEKQLRVDQIALMHGSLNSTAGDAGAHAQQGERGTAQRPQIQNFTDSANSITAVPSFIAEQVVAFDSQGRLSVHA